MKDKRTMNSTPELTSIQGEQQEEAAPLYATDDEVDEWVRQASEGAIVCQSDGRHHFPPARKTGIRFVGVTPLGLFIRRVLCDSCLMVERVEEWDVRHVGDRVTRAEFVSAKLDYLDPTYLAERGHGRMKPKQVRNAVASVLLAGVSFRDTMKAAQSAAKFRLGS
jgi:hypothetical protein